MKKILLPVVTLVVFAMSTVSGNGQYTSAQAVSGTNPRPQAVSGTNPRPQAVSGTNPRPQAVSGTNPRPQVVSSPLDSFGVFFSTMMSMFGM